MLLNCRFIFFNLGYIGDDAIGYKGTEYLLMQLRRVVILTG